MRRLTFALAAFTSTLALAPVAYAQDTDSAEDAEYSDEVGSAAEFDAALDMITGLFAAEPLTAEEEALLPAANRLALAMMPDGFYGEMMSEMMDSVMGPMIGGLLGPEMIIQTRTGASQEAIDALSEDAQEEIALLLDPAYNRRTEVLTQTMTDMFTRIGNVMEGPMREGYARAFAKRFDARQIADIEAFFATPTGGEFAAETMKLFGDPQVMSSVMSSMPAVMGSMTDFESGMERAMAALPPERTYEDLSAEDRARIMAALNLDAEELEMALNARATEDFEAVPDIEEAAE